MRSTTSSSARTATSTHTTLPKYPQPPLRLRLLLTDPTMFHLVMSSRPTTTTIPPFAPLSTLPILPVPPLTHRRRPNLSITPLQQHRMTPNILPLHIPARGEILLSITKTHKPVAFGLGGPLIPDHACFLYGRVFGESFEEGFVGDFAGEVADEEAEVGGVPFEEGAVGPDCAAAGAVDGFGNVVVGGGVS